MSENWKKAINEVAHNGANKRISLIKNEGRSAPVLTKPIGKVLKAKTAEEKAFKVYRDAETDEFKPTSSAAIDLLSNVPPEHRLRNDERELLDAVAANLERSFSMEQVIPEPKRPTIPEEVRLELEKMPTWLGAMVTYRYDKIKEVFKDDTLKFLKGVNIKIDKEYRPEFAYFAGLMTSDQVINYEEAEVARDISEMTLRDPEEGGWTSQEKLFRNDDNVVFLVTEAGQPKTYRFYKKLKIFSLVGKWKRTKENSMMWRPRLVHAVAKKLRHDLTLKPSPGDLVLTRQDVIHHHQSDSEDSDFDEFGKLRWEVIRRREAAQRDAEFELEINLSKVPKLRRRPGYIDEESLKSNTKQLEAKVKALKRKRKDKGHGRVANRRQLYRRGHFRRHSRLLVNSCGEKNVRPKRLEYHVRADDTFHHYIVTLVGSVVFRAFIMFMIFTNAVVLTIEPLEPFSEYSLYFRVADEIFLALYLLEAILKIYAHPIGYWKSGFNVFDFCILMISLIKMANDWLDVADIRFLRVLLIVRALRILRGISLSVQLQVLVAALAQTVRTHVLSVVLLLVLLLYIASIGAFYLFADETRILQESWGNIPRGMLRMIMFVTMDGWTDILEEFDQSGLLTIGRIFNLICIVLGNFMFSNIFIAIIIMNITEATELFRERMRRDKQEIVRRKKENVFRRQKLDMRQLLARQKKSFSTDFFYLSEQFQKLIRHDDLVKMTDVSTSPLWIDALYKTLLRTHHTSVLLMNMHRLMAGNLVDLNRFYNSGKMQIKTIRRGRYNRYMRVKAKLALLKKEILKLRNEQPKPRLRIRLDGPKADEDTNAAQGSTSNM